MILPAAVGSKPMFGGDRSKTWFQVSAGVPESEHLKSVVGYSVVHVVPNSRERDSSHTGQRGTACDCSDLRLHTKQTKDAVKLFADRVGGGGPILGPPRRSDRDLRLSLVRDLDAQRSVHGARRNCSRNASQETT